MSGWLELAAGLALLLGGDGARVEASLEAGRGDGHLPVAFALEVTPYLAVELHRDDALAMAYAASRPRPLPVAPEGAATGDGPQLLSVPTLHLYAPYYARPDGGLVAVRDMPVDVTEYYLHALLELYLEHEVVARRTPYAALLARRAEELYPEVPAAERVGAYTAALADFGSHLFSVANEIERLAERRRRRGGTLCRALDDPRTLPGAWGNVFERSSFYGRYPTAGGRSRDTRAPLAERDKRLFLEHVLGEFWSGDPRADLAPRYCGGAAASGASPP